MKKILVTSSVCGAFLVLGCSDSSGNQSQPTGSGGTSATPSSSKGGQTSSTTSSSGPLGGSSATSSIGNTGSGGSTPATARTTASGGSTTTSGNTGAGGTSSTGPTGAKGGTASTGTAVGKGGTGSTAAGGSSSTSSTSAGGKTGTGVGGTNTKGGSSSNEAGAGPMGGSSVGGSSSSSTNGTPGGASSGVTVQLAQTHQTIDGFGINDTWQALSDAQAKALFDPTTGLGLTILRIGMKPDKTGSAYNNNEESSIAAAKKYGAKTIIGSVWSPPATCKNPNTGKTEAGGHLIESCFGEWSDAIVSFATKFSLYAMSAGNEPDFASCAKTIGPPCTVDYDTTVFTAKEMVAWVKVLGPKLKTAGVKLISPEASEWIHIWSNVSATGSTVANHPNSSDPLKCGCFDANTACASTCIEGNGYDYGHWLYKDKDAWAAVDILGVHQYDTQVAERWPADVPDKKPVWQTEMSGVKYWPEGEPSKDIKNGIAVAKWLHNALTVGDANAWLWWWYKGQDTNEGLYLSDDSDTKRHYTFGNFTRYIRPGYIRVDVTGSIPTNVLLSAYKGSDGKVVVVAINEGTAAATVPIAISGEATPTTCTPNVTSGGQGQDLVAGTAVTVTGGTFSAALVASSVTTFVCK